MRGVRGGGGCAVTVKTGPVHYAPTPDQGYPERREDDD